MLENEQYKVTTSPKKILCEKKKKDKDAIFYNSPKNLEKPKKRLLITSSVSAVKFCEY